VNPGDGSCGSAGCCGLLSLLILAGELFRFVGVGLLPALAIETFAFLPGERLLTDCGKHPLDEVEQPIRIVLVPVPAQLGGVEPRQLVQLLRQILPPQRAGAIDQHRNHPHAALQRSRDLETHVIVGVVQPPGAVFAGERHPLPPDQGHEHCG